MSALPEGVNPARAAAESCALAPASPCVNVCIMDDARGLCRGCQRTLEEIASWGNYSRDEKFAVLKRVAQRRVHAMSATP